MTLEEYQEIKAKLDSGELDYDTLTKEQKAECRRFRLEKEKKLVIERAKILKNNGLPTGLEMLTRDTSRPVYEVASRPTIIYDKSNPEAKKNAKVIKKKREKAIKKTGDKFMKNEKKNRKKAKKRAKKLRKKYKKEEWLKRVKKARKIYKKLPKERKLYYKAFAADNSPEEMVDKIITDREKEKQEEHEMKTWWATWVSWHEFDQGDKQDVKALTHQVMTHEELSPYDKFRKREIASGHPDPKSFCGKWLKPRLQLDEEDKDFYAEHVTIKHYDWKEYKAYLKKKKIKKLSDIVKYRKKFNWNKLIAAEGPSKTGKKHGLESYMYVPMASRDTKETLAEYERIVKSGGKLKGMVKEFAEFIRQHTEKMDQETYDNLEKLIERNDKSVDKLVKDAKAALQFAEYESMRDETEEDKKWKPMDLDCTINPSILSG